MKRVLSYDQQTVASSNPAARFSHQFRYKRSAEIVRRHLPDDGTLLDYGAGQGRFLHAMKSIHPHATLVGFDAYVEPLFPGLSYVGSMDEVGASSIDVVTAFEVCEHLNDTQLNEFLRNAHRVLSETGVLILSVPIMFGPIVVLKEASKMVTHRRRCQYSLSELARVVAGQPINRPEDPQHTHKGFDFRKLRRSIESQFSVENVTWSPFPSLPWVVNSQMFLVARRQNRV